MLTKNQQGTIIAKITILVILEITKNNFYGKKQIKQCDRFKHRHYNSQHNATKGCKRLQIL